MSMKKSNKQNDNSVVFKNKVRELMKIYNISEEDFNLAIDRHRGYIERVLNNNDFEPSIDTILRIAYMFEIDYRELVDEKPYNFFCRELLLPAMFKQGITIDELSSKTGVQVKVFTNLYRNKTKFPSLSKIRAIAKAVHVNPNEWMLAIGNHGSKDSKNRRIRM